MLMSIFVGFAIFVGSIVALQSEDKPTTCDLTEVQKCVGAASDIVPYVYFNPLDVDLISSIKQNFCGTGLESCMGKAKGNCSDNSLAPYKTITSTVHFVCNVGTIDTNIQESCLNKMGVRHQLSACFRMFKVVVDSILGDTTLDISATNAGLCRAYKDVASCSVDVTLGTCDIAYQSFVDSLLDVTSRASRSAMGCTGDLLSQF